MSMIECHIHSFANEAFICAHIVEGVINSAPTGFIWARDDHGIINAYCNDCDEHLNAYGGEWTDEVAKFANVKLSCEKCALSAAKFNGVEGSL